MRRYRFLLVPVLLVAACSTTTPAPTPSATGQLAPTIAAGGPTPTPRITPTPVPVAGCPAGAPMTVTDFVEADELCFSGEDIQIRAWLDEPPGIGFEPPGIEPGWLYYPSTELSTLWEAPPNEPNGVCSSMGDRGCAWFFWHIDPASGLELAGPPRWLIVTGHREDRAAATCRYVYPDGWVGDRYDEAMAVEFCMSQFVVVAFRDAP